MWSKLPSLLHRVLKPRPGYAAIRGVVVPRIILIEENLEFGEELSRRSRHSALKYNFKPHGEYSSGWLSAGKSADSEPARKER